MQLQPKIIQINASDIVYIMCEGLWARIVHGNSKVPIQTHIKGSVTYVKM